ncbi:MAG: type IV secretory system conjugative DNA transfer family protein, partial [Clostridiales bacterium]|nr:type IV secretory system conjugative DNA transfer family protein [Clostridiales bacterium]
MTKERMILGEGCIYSMDSRETGRNNNVIVCGSSGSGKTMSVSEPRLLETTDSSLIASVTKKRLVEKYTPLFQKRGYEILHLNFAKPMESSCSYDPLLYVENDADITFLAKSIVMADPQKKKNTRADPYWDHAAVSLLSAEIAYTRMTKEDATFADVLVLHDSLVLEEKSSLVQTSLDSAFHRIALENPGCFAASCWRSFKNLPTRTAGCVFGTLNTIIDTFFSQELRKMMSAENRIDLEQLGMKKTVLFLSSSPVNPSLHGFMNLFFAQAFKQLFEYAESRPDGVLPVPVHVLGDDFATGGCIYNFPEHISIFREKGISVTLLLQSESQLEQMYGPANASAILDNCDSYVYLGGMDLWTARKISLRLDVPLEEILSMPVGQEVVFRRG